MNIDEEIEKKYKELEELYDVKIELEKAIIECAYSKSRANMTVVSGMITMLENIGGGVVVSDFGRHYSQIEFDSESDLEEALDKVNDKLIELKYELKNLKKNQIHSPKR